MHDDCRLDVFTRTNFLAGCWCSTRSSLNFEICGAVPKYRFKISWSVPSYRLDWIVLGYSRCRPLAPPMSSEPPSSANPRFFPPRPTSDLPIRVPTAPDRPGLCFSRRLPLGCLYAHQFPGWLLVFHSLISQL